MPRAPDDALRYVALEAFRKDPEKHALKTASGKLEIHCQALADLVDRSGWTRIRAIPTYNPPVEGYEATFADWASKSKGPFPLQCQNMKYLRRAHSTMDNVPWLREAFSPRNSG